MRWLVRYSAIGLWLLLLSAAPALALTEQGVQVKFSASTKYEAKKGAEKRAKEEAVRAYVSRAHPGVDKACLKKVVEGYAAFVKNMTQQDFVYDYGQAEVSYKVWLDDAAVNRALEELGCGVQSAQVVFFIMEEPPTAASMSLILDEAAMDGVKPLQGLGPFVDFYPDFQRAIRDAITRKAGDEGLTLTWLEKTPAMERHKVARDDPLMGVYFDMQSSEFKVNEALMREVRNVYASKNAIIYYYRIDSLYFDQKSRVLKAKISISLLNLRSNEAKSVGAQEFAVTVREKVPSVALRDGLAEVAANAAALNMNAAKTEARRMASSAQARAGKEAAAPGVVTVILTSKRTLYKLKEQVAGSKSVAKAAMDGEALVLTLAGGVAVDDFVFGELYGELEGLGLAIPEDHVTVQGKTCTIRQ